MPTYKNPDDADNDLQKILLEASPVNANGNKTMSNLAEAIGVTRWAMHKWVIKQQIPPRRAMQVVEVSEGRVSLEDFKPFVYKQ